MKVNKYFQKAVIIPNGVDIDVFKPIDKKEAQKQVGFKSKKNIVFIGNPSRREKNSRLAFDAFDLLEGSNLELNVVSGVQFKDIPYYYNAADLLLLTSLWEGSPNVIKEAMACNCPVVATDVGDVAWVMGNEPGYYLATFDPEDVAKKVLLALQYSESHGRTNGRQRIIKLGLDAETTAKRLISVYQATLQ
ncbi:MAG: glycosyltransferase family 4 protein [Desulfobacterales bacterium]|nr:glycosyltransferase family 4 protein [Desulfobacterales bacterium]